MKSNGMFRDQVNSVNSWFESWNGCEKTVVIYGLLKHLSASECKFLAQVLQQKDCSEVDDLEIEANDPNYVSQLCNEPKEQAIQKLLAHLPLLKVGNRKAKTEYLVLIPQILSYSNENGAYVEESKQLLSYSVIHPALTSEEHAHFNWWITHLNERFSNHGHLSNPKEENSDFTQTVEKTLLRTVGSGRLNGSFSQYRDTHQEMLSPNNHGNILLSAENLSNVPTATQSNVYCNSTNQHLPLHATLSAPATVNTAVVPSSHYIIQSQDNHVNPVNHHNKLCRTTSINPASLSNVSDWLHNSSEVPFSRGRSGSLTFDQVQGHPPLSPQSSITSSGSSETHQDVEPIKNSFLEEGSGMRDVPTWLKSLRLHKYAGLFQQMTYEEMMNVTEEWLEAQNVTKGARHKIVISIGKLKERQELLRQMEREIVEGGSVKPVRSMKPVLSEMKSMLNSPLKAFPSSGDLRVPSSPPPSPISENENSSIAEGDIPAQFTRAMGKACTQLLVTSPPDDECFNLFLQVIDKCINHEAFSQKQKKRLASWKHEAQRIWQPKYNLDKKGKSGWPTIPFANSNRMNMGGQRPMRLQKSGPQWSFGAKRSIVGGTTSGHAPLQRNASLNPAMFSNPGPLETQKQPVTRTHSAPLRSQHLGLNITGCDQSPSENLENYAQLDSLCLSVTEHALGSLEK